ncbi:hypothetical protein OG205_04080 [Lentzea sp. NBC_00516]|uniref:hypothetical protein n=1 Tax=Lentzea sp. NBC_00516 TaxID=2903582 RepID=UPI002E802137|nr:hypothetical protein [Lentzea sp. NBC_00516]WUD26197.1 hypothetical protein OG205_04080 [Lentzea sp. NBC_00516]
MPSTSPVVWAWSAARRTGLRAELYGEIYLCRIPQKLTNVRVRAYDAAGRLLREAEI